MKPSTGRNRVVIEAVTPQVDRDHPPPPRILGDLVTFTAAIFGDGHDHLAAHLLYRHKSDRRWRSVPMTDTGNDLWTAAFRVNKLGSWRFAIQAWVDHFDTWASDLKKRLAAQPDPANPKPTDVPQDIPVALRSGALLLEATAKRASGADARTLTEMVKSLRWMADQDAALYEYPLNDDVLALAARYPDLEFSTRTEPDLTLWVDRERARF